MNEELNIFIKAFLKRYVRTKDIVFELEVVYSDPYQDKTFCVSTKGERYVIEDVISSSDILENLFDGYFAISNTGYKTPVRIDFENKIIYQWQSNDLVVCYTFEQFIPYHTVYGGIWTDGCIIYVAKMNNKGKFILKEDIK